MKLKCIVLQLRLKFYLFLWTIIIISCHKKTGWNGVWLFPGSSLYPVLVKVSVWFGMFREKRYCQTKSQKRFNKEQWVISLLLLFDEYWESAVNLRKMHWYCTFSRLCLLYDIYMSTRIKIKALMFAYRTTSCSVPLYLNALLQTYMPSRSLRSACEQRITVPSQRGAIPLSMDFFINCSHLV